MKYPYHRDLKRHTTRQEIAFALYEYRANIGYTQQQMAQEIGMNQQSYWKLENAECFPPMRQMLWILDYIGKTLKLENIGGKDE